MTVRDTANLATPKTVAVKVLADVAPKAVLTCTCPVPGSYTLRLWTTDTVSLIDTDTAKLQVKK